MAAPRLSRLSLNLSFHAQFPLLLESAAQETSKLPQVNQDIAQTRGIPQIATFDVKLE